MNSRGPVGGAANEAGSVFRAGVATSLVVQMLLGQSLGKDWAPRGDSTATITEIGLETAEPVDDIRASLSDGRRVLVQAKRQLRLGRDSASEFGSVVRQWRAAFVDGHLDANVAGLVLAVGSASGSIHALAEAIRRTQRDVHPIYPTQETEALGILKVHLADLAPDQKSELLASISIVVLRVEEDGRDDALLKASSLEGKVVEEGEGPLAWATIRGSIPAIARQRGSRNLASWVALLQDAGLHVVSDASRSAASSQLFSEQLVRTYRAAIREECSQIDLRPLGIPVPRIPAEGFLAEVKVMPEVGNSGNDRPVEKEFDAALRRRGRVLLVGLPGSGKSTLLRLAAANCAEDDEGPLPILLDVTELIHEGDLSSPIDRIVTAAGRWVDEIDRPPLARAIRARALAGSLVLFIDGLDEARARRPDAIRQIEAIRDAVHRDVEIVVATRDVGFADARTLGFPTLRVGRPSDILSSVRVVLGQLATTLNVAGDHSDWIRERANWIDAVLDRDPVARETPLIPLVLASIAADQLPPFPTTRAALLSRAIEIPAMNWELRKTKFSPGPRGNLEGAHAAAAALEAFDVLAYALIDADSIPRRQARRLVAERLVNGWGLANGEGLAWATDLLEFWDIAGVFIFESSGGAIRSRHRLFVEVGAARYLAGLPPVNQREIVASALPRDDMSEMLALAAGLSETVATYLVDEAVARWQPSTLLLAARAVREGASVDAIRQRRLLDCLLSALEIRHALGDGHAKYSIAKAIARLPLDQARVPEALAAFGARLPANEEAVARVLVCSASAPNELLDACEYLVGVFVPDTSDASVGIGTPNVRYSWGPFPDEGFNESVEICARAVIQAKPALAEQTARLATHASMYVAERVRAHLVRHGFTQVVRDVWPSYGDAERWGRMAERFDEGMTWLFRSMTGLAEPAALTLRQRRSLSELADLIETLGIGSAPAYAVDDALSRGRELLAPLLDASMKLGSFDRSVVSAQALEAQSARDEYGRLSFLSDGARRRDLDQWGTVDVPAVEDQFCAVLGIGEWLPEIAIAALRHHPSPLKVSERIIDLLPTLELSNREDPGRLVLALRLDFPDQLDDIVGLWITGSDVPLRRAAASVVAATGSELLKTALDDLDGGVQQAALRALMGRPMDEDIRAHVALMVERSQPGWLCTRCGTNNRSGLDACARCRIVGPEPSRLARTLLDATLRGHRVGGVSSTT